jgi:hypothetical protein
MFATDAINATAQSSTNIMPMFKEGDQVWLEVKNLQLLHGSVKLTPWCYGPFQVEQIINPVTFKICLLMSWNVHPVFHTSLLTRVTENSTYGPIYT